MSHSELAILIWKYVYAIWHKCITSWRILVLAQMFKIISELCLISARIGLFHVNTLVRVIAKALTKILMYCTKPYMPWELHKVTGVWIYRSCQLIFIFRILSKFILQRNTYSPYDSQTVWFVVVSCIMNVQRHFTVFFYNSM